MTEPGAHASLRIASTLGPTPPPREGATLTRWGNARAILYGGIASNLGDLADVWLLHPSKPADGGEAAVLTPDTDLTWVELDRGGDTPPARSGHSAVLIEAKEGPKIRIFGGFGGNHFLSDMLDYDLTLNRWISVRTGNGGPSARRGHAACSDTHGRMFVFGGVGRKGTLLDGLLCLEPDASGGSTNGTTVLHRWRTFDLYSIPGSWPSNSSAFDYSEDLILRDRSEGSTHSRGSRGGPFDSGGGGGGGSSSSIDAKTLEPTTPVEEGAPLLPSPPITGTLIDYPVTPEHSHSSASVGSSSNASSTGGGGNATSSFEGVGTGSTSSSGSGLFIAGKIAPPLQEVPFSPTATTDSDSPMTSPFVDTMHPPGLYDHSLCYDEESDAIYLAGGLSAGGMLSTDIWKLSVGSKQWTQIPLLGCHGRSRHQAFLLDPSTMIVVGGTRGSSNATFACETMQLLDLGNKAARTVILDETAVDGTPNTQHTGNRCLEEAASYDFVRRSWLLQGSSAERRDFCLAAFPAADNDWQKMLVLLWGGRDGNGYCAPGLWLLSDFAQAPASVAASGMATVPAHLHHHRHQGDHGDGKDAAPQQRACSKDGEAAGYCSGECTTFPVSKEKASDYAGDAGDVDNVDDGYSAATSSGVSSLESAHYSEGLDAAAAAPFQHEHHHYQQRSESSSTVDGTVSDGSDAYASGSGGGSGRDSGSSRGFQEAFSTLYDSSGAGQLFSLRAPSNETVRSGSELAGPAEEDGKPSTEKHEPDREGQEGSTTPQDREEGVADRSPAGIAANSAEKAGGKAPSSLASKLTNRLSTELGSQGAVRRGSAGAIQWSKGKLLGIGAYGSVFACMDDNGIVTGVPGRFFAAKQMPLQGGGADTRVDGLIKEIRMLQSLNHPNIVRYLGHEVDKDQASAYIFMEYCSGGDLRTVLRSFGGVAQAVASNYTRQVVRGLGYLHDNDVLHRDIKGANILLFASGVCKLGDFGLARAVASIVPPGGPGKSMAGTPFWMAPEVIQGRGTSRNSDIWSLGATVFEMGEGKPPFSDLEPTAALFYIGSVGKLSKPVPESLGDDGKDFVVVCMSKDPSTRPTCHELLQHRFLS